MPKFGGASAPSTPKLVYGLVLSLKPASPATLKYTLANLLWVSVLASLFNNSSITSWELKQFSKYRWGWVQWLKVGTYACGTLQANRYSPPFKTAYQAEAWGNSPTKKGNQLVTVWFDNCQVAVLSSNFSLNQTVTVRRMKEAPHVKSIPSLRAISTWEVLIWKTSWDLTIPLVAKELGGGDTFVVHPWCCDHKCNNFGTPFSSPTIIKTSLPPSVQTWSGQAAHWWLLWEEAVSCSPGSKSCREEENMHQLLEP